jgi:hypothetical protein
VDGRIDERFHDEEHIGRAGPETAVAIATNFSSSTLELGPERAEQGARLGALLGGRLRRRVPDGHPPTQPGRRVGHAPDDLAVAEEPLEGGRRGPRDHRQDELAGVQMRLQLATDAGQHLGLDREQDDIGLLDRLGVPAHGPDPVQPAELLASLRARMAGHDPTRRHQLATEQPGDHRLGHHAGADGGDGPLREGGHGAEYTVLTRPVRRT